MKSVTKRILNIQLVVLVCFGVVVVIVDDTYEN